MVDEQKGGGLVDAQGRRVTIRSNKLAFTKLKDQRGAGGASAELMQQLSAAAPEHLKCPLCHSIVQVCTVTRHLTYTYMLCRVQLVEAAVLHCAIQIQLSCTLG